jgi:hypothetical protein
MTEAEFKALRMIRTKPPEPKEETSLVLYGPRPQLETEVIEGEIVDNPINEGLSVEDLLDHAVFLLAQTVDFFDFLTNQKPNGSAIEKADRMQMRAIVADIEHFNKSIQAMQETEDVPDSFPKRCPQCDGSLIVNNEAKTICWGDEIEFDNPEQVTPREAKLISKIAATVFA